MKVWNVLYKNPVGSDLKTIKKILLNNRGLTTPHEIQEFLTPENPLLIPIRATGIDEDAMHIALKRIQKAIEAKESIVVYADYDADGVTSGAILWESLYILGASVMPYIPHRVDEGYGLSVKGIERVKKEYNPSLIITVDQGITCVRQIEYAQSLGIDVIVTDHHAKPSEVPQVPTIHTSQLCAAGISWFLSRELLNGGNKDICKDQLTLASLGTVADMMPLIGINRSLVTYGIEQFSQTKRCGINALMKQAGLTPDEISASDISHILAPRLNAAGRIEHAMDALRLLCTKNKQKADELSQKLGDINSKRQQMTIDASLHALETTKDITKQSAIIAAHESYNQGIIGLVAGKLVEKYYRPSVVISIGESISKASARSIAGFNIIEALRELADLLLEVGGHPMAAGFSLETAKIAQFKKRFIAIADEKISSDMLTKSLTVDFPLDCLIIDEVLWEMLDSLRPFGIGNAEPVFMTGPLVASDVRCIGSTAKHLKGKLKTEKENMFFDFVAFNMADRIGEFTYETPFEIAFTIDMNTWNNRSNLQLKVRDIRMCT